MAIDSPLPHLDRLFDYAVPECLADVAQPGVRVRVRFAGKLIDGFLLERADVTDHQGRLAPLDRVVGSEPVLTPEVAELARAVADRWAGTLSDTLRLAVPPRHARVENQSSEVAVIASTSTKPDLGRYDGGEELARALGEPAHAPVRCSWAMLPGAWRAELASVVAVVVQQGRGVIVVVPDARQLTEIGAAIASVIGAASVVELAAGLGPQERYRRFLRVLRGAAQVVVGTRAAVWAPVHNLGLIVVWDDGNDLLAEPRAPYPHAREVAALRSHLQSTDLLLAGHAVSTDAQHLVETGWARALDPTSKSRSAAWATTRAADDDATSDGDPAARAARLPSIAWRVARDALASPGPVLVQVPRRGYAPRLTCAACRTPARCRVCAGPLGRSADGARPRCAWCGVPVADWRCQACGDGRLRFSVVGVRRTAEELGRAFARVPIRTSGGGAALATVSGEPALIVATPGAEPTAEGGYAAALLLDGWMLLARADLRATEEALRRWLAAAALVRSGRDGGRVVVMAASALPVTQALIAASPRRLARRELDDRRALHLPPTARLASLTGTSAALREVESLLELPAGAELLGPVDVAGEPEHERLMIRVPTTQGRALASSLHAASAVRSARKSGEPVRVVVDPVAIG